MARRAEASQKTVWAAMERLRDAKDLRWESPGRIRAAIGGVGSFTTIARHRDSWHAMHGGTHTATGLDQKIQVPAEAREATEDAFGLMLDKTWRAALDHTSALTEQVRQDAAQKVLLAERERTEALDEALRLEHELAETEAKAESFKTRIKELEAMSADLAMANKGLQESIEQALNFIEKQHETLTQARLIAIESDQAARANAVSAETERKAIEAFNVELKISLTAADGRARVAMARIGDLETELSSASAQAAEARSSVMHTEKRAILAEAEAIRLASEVEAVRHRARDSDLEAVAIAVVRGTTGELRKIMAEKRQAVGRSELKKRSDELSILSKK